jgi:hypothetical protein
MDEARQERSPRVERGRDPVARQREKERPIEPPVPVAERLRRELAREGDVALAQRPPALDPGPRRQGEQHGRKGDERTHRPPPELPAPRQAPLHETKLPQVQAARPAVQPGNLVQAGIVVPESCGGSISPGREPAEDAPRAGAGPRPQDRAVLPPVRPSLVVAGHRIPRGCNEPGGRHRAFR